MMLLNPCTIDYPYDSIKGAQEVALTFCFFWQAACSFWLRLLVDLICTTKQAPTCHGTILL